MRCGDLPVDLRPPRVAARRVQGLSADLGVLAAIQLHDIGVVAAPWLGGVSVPAAVRLHDWEARPGDQLAQAPHSAQARERHSHGMSQRKAQSESSVPAAHRNERSLGVRSREQSTPDQLVLRYSDGVGREVRSRAERRFPRAANLEGNRPVCVADAAQMTRFCAQEPWADVPHRGN